MIRLLKIVSDRKVGGKKFRFKYRKKPKNEFECMDNIQIALNFLEAKGVKMVNIGAGDIYHGHKKITLGLIWTIIRVFQIDAHEGIAESGEDDAEHVGEPHAARPKPSSGAQRLLQWCQGVVKPYAGFGVKVRDFGRSFSDGRALAALIHAHVPEMVDLNLLGDDARDNLSYIMTVATANLGMPAMLDEEDIDLLVTDPDSVSKVVQLYVFQSSRALYHAHPNLIVLPEQVCCDVEGTIDGSAAREDGSREPCRDRPESIPRGNIVNYTRGIQYFRLTVYDVPILLRAGHE